MVISARNLLRGEIDIQGDEEYSVVIKRDDEVFAELPLQNGMFEVFTPLEEGSYNVEIYELEDDEDGFGNVASFLIAHYQVELINQYNLSNKKSRFFPSKIMQKSMRPLNFRGIRDRRFAVCQLQYGCRFNFWDLEKRY